ncbi:MAG: TlyA family RNA methyltransferase, partial [Bradymonadia bacterium]
MKIKLDQLLVDRDMVADLKEAQARILAGEVIVDEQRMDKRGQLVDERARIRIRTRKGRTFVSRGGQKLDHALKVSSTTI